MNWPEVSVDRLGLYAIIFIEELDPLLDLAEGPELFLYVLFYGDLSYCLFVVDLQTNSKKSI